MLHSSFVSLQLQGEGCCLCNSLNYHVVVILTTSIKVCVHSSISHCHSPLSGEFFDMLCLFFEGFRVEMF